MLLKVDGKSLCLSWYRILPSVLGIAEWLFYDCVGRTGVQNKSLGLWVLRPWALGKMRNTEAILLPLAM